MDKGIGPAVHSPPVSPEVAKRFEGKLPAKLLLYWQQYGWSGYGNGQWLRLTLARLTSEPTWS
jgi:hypothetical protein